MQHALTSERRRLVDALARDRQELRTAAADLQRALGRRVTLGGRMSDRPAPWLLGSFVVGLFLGSR